MNATSRVQDYLERSSKRLRDWQDEKLSVEAPKPEPEVLRLIASFPPAPRDMRGLQLRTGLGGARKS